MARNGGEPIVLVSEELEPTEYPHHPVLIFEKRVNPARVTGQHFDRAPADEINKVVRTDEDFVLPRFKHGADCTFGEWRRGQIVRKHSILVNQCMRRRSDQKITVCAAAYCVDRFADQLAPDGRVD